MRMRHGAPVAGAARAGDVILSAAPGWDLRERYEPTPHHVGGSKMSATTLSAPESVVDPARLS